MSKKLYIVIDVQNDFISGALGSERAQEVTPKIADFLSKVKNKENTVAIWATRDTHYDKDTKPQTYLLGDNVVKHDISESAWYENTLEGKKLPVPHCIKDTWGWQIDDRVASYFGDNDKVFDKNTFMSIFLGKHIGYFMKDIKMDMSHEIDEIVFMGFCTGICVASNAIYLRGLMPNMKITVLEDLCACVNEDTHKAALTTMGCCQIDIENSEEFLKNVL